MRWFLSVILLLIVSITQAQDADYWYYMVDDGGTLYGYNTADGEIRTVATDFDDFQVVLRIDEERLFTFIELSDDVYQLTLITPDGVEAVVSDLPGIFIPVDYNPPYLVMGVAVPSFLSEPAIVINLDTYAVTYLTVASIGSVSSCCALDGNMLHYAFQEGEEIQLRTLNLETQEEETFFSSPRTSYLIPSQDATLWIMRDMSTEGDVRQQVFSMIDTSGEVTILSEHEVSASPTLPKYLFFEDYLITIYQFCEVDCVYTFTDLNTGESRDFMAQPNAEFLQPVYIDEDVLITYSTDSALLRVTQDAPPEVLGYRNMMSIHGIHTSPDGLWYVVADDITQPQQIMVWNYESQYPVVQQEIQDNNIYNVIHHDDYLALINLMEPSTSLIIDKQTNEVFDISGLNATRVHIIGIVDNELLLRIGDDDMTGVYRYNWETEELTLLMEGNLFWLEGRSIASF